MLRRYGEEDLKPDEFMTYIHQFAQTFKEALNQVQKKREEDERVRTRREAFLKTMQEKEQKQADRKAGRRPPTKEPPPKKDILPPKPKDAPGASSSSVGGKDLKEKETEALLAPGQRSRTGSIIATVNKERDGGEKDKGGGDPVSDLLNGMPKSGKFTVKKEGMDSGGSKVRFLEHFDACEHDRGEGSRGERKWEGGQQREQSDSRLSWVWVVCDVSGSHHTACDVSVLVCMRVLTFVLVRE